LAEEQHTAQPMKKVTGISLLNQLKVLGWKTFPKSDFLLHLENQIF